METISSFGYWIRRQRKALDLTQQALADRVGCSVAAIKKIEGDERRPSRQIAERMADVLGVPADHREIFLEVARGLRSVDQLALAREPAAPSLPSGIVTFLYTDIEGSTRLAQEHPKEWETRRARHHAILREAVESNNGYIFQVVGDGFCAAFYTPNDGLRAAIDAQRKLQNENWKAVPIKVRMGLHTGEAEAHENEYSGYLTLSLVQRIMSAGHGGQILLSYTTENLLRSHLPPDISLLDLGEHKFKDILQPVRVFQIITPDLQKDFPALRALDVFPNNLPNQLTSFIGRERELDEVKHLLSNTRLLTLTGPGGTGKTRLALHLAADILAAKKFTNGVWLVELAPLADPVLITQTIVTTLGVREQPRTTLLDALTNYLRAKSMLLILDNCEHLIQMCAQITENLLHVAPLLKILATSREPLGIGGETIFRVPSLPLPESQQLHDLDTLEQNDCVHLFIDRAMSAYPSFHLKDKNASAITDICRKLDGIPLAIELAAARIKVFPPEEIAARLDDRFKLLTGGSRTALERHQTLFALIEWSHNLLSEQERVFLRRLSVFAGGWSFESAQEVCGDELGNEILDLLTHLVEKSLVAVDEETEEARYPTGGSLRYRLPETIRQYARDKLFESGEAEQIRDHHLDYFLHFAEEAEPKLRSAEQLEWLNRVEAEHDNLRTALAWSLESDKSDRALQLGGALGYFWVLRGNFSEGHKWLNDALAVDEREQRERAASDEKYVPTPAEMAHRAKALFGATWFQLGTLNLKNAHTTLEESLRLWRELGDKWWMAVDLELMGLVIIMEGDIQTAIARDEEGVSLARQVGDPWPLALCLIRLGDDLKVKGTDMAAARRSLEEGVALARKTGDKSVLSEGLRELGSLYHGEGHLTAAASVIEEALAEARAIGSMQVFLALLELVMVSCLQNDLMKAAGYCSEVWALVREMGSPFANVFVIMAFGFVASFGEEPGKGARLLAATETLIGQSGANLTPTEGSPFFKVYKQALAKAQVKLGPAAFQAAWAEGQQMTMEQAIALATEDEDQDSSPA